MTTVQTPSDTAREQQFGVASARSYLWELAQQIDGASKDAGGFHLPLDEDAETWLHAKIADVSEPQSAFGYHFDLVAWIGDTYAGMPHQLHHDRRDDVRRFYRTQGQFERDRLERALQSAIDWADA
jgi:hypothetical protein